MNAARHPTAAQPRSGFALWLGVIGPPLVWLVQFQARYVLASAPPGSGRHATLVIIGIVALAAVVALGLMARREWLRAGASPLDQMAGAVERIRFMGMLGLMLAALSFLLILAQLLAGFFIPPGES